MRRVFVIFLIILLAGGVSATTYNFQNPGDNSSVEWFGTWLSNPKKPAFINWAESGTGSNNYVTIRTYIDIGSGDTYACARLKNPYQMTYAAMTAWATGGTGTYNHPVFILYDENKASLQFTNRNIPWAALNTQYRYEVRISGGIPRYYRDGTLIYTGAAIAKNPSYICMGQSRPAGGGYDLLAIDDLNWAEPNAMILGLPESDENMFVMLKDIVNPAASGLAFGENGTIVNTNYMSGTWARGNSSIDAGTTQPNETIQLKHFGTGTVYATNYTGTGYKGTMTWNIHELIFESGAPQGYYYLYYPKTGEVSNMILYKSNGADVQWNSPTYSSGDSATVIYYVLDGGYWDTSTYSYRLDIYDVYGNVKATNVLTASSGTISHAWSSSDEPGIYYAMLIAKDGSGNDYYLGSDQAELVSYFRVYGTVHNGPNTTPISGAMVNISQSTASQSVISGSIGNYTTEAVFVSGGTMNVTATADGCRPYTYSFVPLISKTISLNITLLPTTPVPGLAIDGVARDPTYGRPLEGVQVLVRNITNSQSYDRVTNMAGWYQCSLGEACNLVYGRPYDVNGTKLGYSNSPIYNVTASGVLT